MCMTKNRLSSPITLAHHNLHKYAKCSTLLDAFSSCGSPVLGTRGGLLEAYAKAGVTNTSSALTVVSTALSPVRMNREAGI